MLIADVPAGSFFHNGHHLYLKLHPTIIDGLKFEIAVALINRWTEKKLGMAKIGGIDIEEHSLCQWPVAFGMDIFVIVPPEDV